MRYLLAFVLMLAGGKLLAAEIAIVQDGRSDFAIVTSADASPAEQLAAEELARYIKQMSGAQLRTLHGKAPSRAIVLAVEGEGESYAVTADGSTIRITGGQGGAVLFATYQLLDALGCRFLAPQYDHYDGTAEVIPQSKTLVFRSDEPIKGKPALKYRKLYVEEGHSHTEQNLKQMIEWMPKVGFNVLVVPTDYQGRGRVRWDSWREALTPELQKRQIMIEVGGHGYQNFINAEMENGKLFEQHPRWFGANPKGVRQKGHNWVLCTSNEDAVAYMTRNVIAYVKDRPEIQIFDLWPPDGARWCECSECNQIGEPAERHALLMNQVYEQFSQAHPDVRLECIAYQRLIAPPQKHALNEQILVDFCPIRQNFEYSLFDPEAPKEGHDGGVPNEVYSTSLREWRQRWKGEISIYSYYRRYAWDSLPMILPHRMQEELRAYAAIPTQGVSSYSEPADWFTYELNHYALAKLSQDQNADVDALIRRFCAARYQEAAPAAMQAFAVLAENVPKVCSIPYVYPKSKEQVEGARKEFEQSAQAVKAAESAARDGGVRHNLRRLSLMHQYALKDLDLQLARHNGASADELREQAIALHEWVSKHADEGVFLVKNNRLSPGKLIDRYAKAEPAPVREVD